MENSVALEREKERKRRRSRKRMERRKGEENKDLFQVLWPDGF